MSRPVRGALAAAITQGFGANPQFTWQLGYGHLGCDWGLPEGTPLYAPRSGRVVWADWGQKMGGNPWYQVPANGNSGIHVIVEVTADNYWDLCHMSRTDLNVGDWVNEGDLVGLSGNTGLSTGPHTHAEVAYKSLHGSRTFGRINPLPYMDEGTAAGPDERWVGAAVVFQRDRAHRDGNVKREIAPQTLEKFIGYVVGEPVNLGGVNSNIWYVDVGDDGKYRYSWAGGFTEQKTAGLKDLTPPPPPAPLAPNQRKVGPAGGNARALPDPTSPVVRALVPNGIETFIQWTRGAMVDLGGIKTDIWYLDSQGAVWAGLFLSQDTKGLPEKPKAAPPAPVTVKRNVGADVAIVRAQADKNSQQVDQLAPGTVVEPAGYVQGIAPYPDSSPNWLRVGKGYASVEVFTNKTVDGLTRLAYTAPVTRTYDFVLDFAEINGIKVQKAPAHIDNVDVGNFPSTPAMIVDHWWNDPALRPSFDGIIAEFQNPTFKSPHFMVSDTRIAQNVSLKDRAYHAGPQGNVYVGIEIDPNITEKGYANVRALHKALNEKYGIRLTLTLHKNVPGNNTSCSGFDLERFKVVDAVVPPVKVPEFIVTTPEEEAAIRRYLEWSLQKLGAK